MEMLVIYQNILRTDSKDYLYPHDFPNAYVKQQYLPDKIKNKKYYYPKTIGYEKTISEIYKKIEQLKKRRLKPFINLK